ncbi:unnamed protein product [Brassica oleracea]|uniref:Ubiquitin-like domain-containing protein n=3 Tax=Brassica TaxID=3705 RepID=A0A0D3C3L8_BRAOL|nr:PREDICTED: uncharacterized protein LOC106339067 [Brassica oleracea var. oleracea]KAF3577879.1 hypothetical protein DY000_02035031 [Brassica cretica]VDD14447.1 unnamed protein product [Brassica oleracea]
MRVSVEIITGTFINTEVSENATVKELKEKIAKEVQLSVRRLILVVGNEEERRMVMEDEDETMLIDLGVREDSHMYLFFKHPDFGYKEESSQGKKDDASMEETAESKRRNGEEDEEAEAETDCEDEDTSMKNGEEYNVNVDDR